MIEKFMVAVFLAAIVFALTEPEYVHYRNGNLRHTVKSKSPVAACVAGVSVLVFLWRRKEWRP